jgi:hypothetical protein
MTKHSSHILTLARKGAEHKYQELKAEIATLLKHFPDLAGKHGLMARGASAVTSARQTVGAAIMGTPQPRKKRKMSAKARAAISAAQKARWKKLKAGEKG